MKPTILLLTFFLLSFPASATGEVGCSDLFISHDLPHTTTTSGGIVHFYESNGSGVGVNDLNNDGLLDVVLGNLQGANTILWNLGGLQFRAEPFLISGQTRDVKLIDVDADGWQDIVLTTQRGAPSWWRNNGDETFTLEALPGVTHLAQVTAWNDVDGDGDLDLVTASYDAELLKLLRDSFLFNGGAGVYFYENDGGTFHATRLADQAQGLALWLSDLDEDGKIDLIVGNDFSLPDQAWTFDGGAWVARPSFPVTTFSTMSFDAGDLDNDGKQELFAADMRPLPDEPDAARSWRYVFESLDRAARLPGDAQISENVLLFPDGTCSGEAYVIPTDDARALQAVNCAEAAGVAATGWTWSSQFGDLNDDGFLDLYAVNGMAARELFPQLPNNELVEANQAFRGDGGGRFIPAPEWGLGSTRGGRGMTMADLDNDGDLDIVVNNLNAPAQLFENDLCGGASLEVGLHWQGVQNRDGIGARLTLTTTSGTYSREMTAASGYLSGDPARAHFGFPSGSRPLRLNVRWTDGVVTSVTLFPSFDSDNSILIVTR